MKTLRLIKDFYLFQRFEIYALMLLLMFSLSSCFQKFYKTNTVATTDSATLTKLVAENKTFILHTPDSAFEVKNPTVATDAFSGEKAALNPKYHHYLDPMPNDPNRLNMKKSGVVLNEVHLYTNNIYTGTGKINLGINQIYRVDIYEFDKKATQNSKTLGIVGISVGVGAIAFLAIVVLTSGFGNPAGNIQFNFH
jgi:ABC-type antimicrobial peptide transport system permease subunit